MRWGLTATQVEPYVGSEFSIWTEGTPRLRILLAEVARLPARSPSEGRRDAGSGDLEEPFRLVFAGPERPTLPRGLHLLQHDELGHVELLLVPIAPGDGSGPRYEARFS